MSAFIRFSTDTAAATPAAKTARSLPPKFEMKACETQAERRSAFQLVYESYRRAGLIPDNQMQMRVLEQHLVDTTDLMVAKQDNKVCFTVTLVRDGLYGMPAESLFGKEIDAMRRNGLRLAEVSCVAGDCEKEDKRQRFDTLVKMISLTIQAARRRDVDRLLLAVHPRHAKVYQRLFGCKICTDVRDYDAVQGNPAVLCTHDFKELDETGYSLSEKVYGTEFSPWQLDGTRMTAAEKAYFAQAVSQQKPRLVTMAA
ncbi:N-acyl amino acid synthase FeeM domain-containing protein [Roseimaritima ulvae]|uniref:N-acyl amino acid synthase FeeM catalytic core domain-containing protein n=1 Tax=Roseimaritima ulvae TaxID=980254 RepID=A0A5B9R791_9BACT|nr:hypothetical protein [Roseimaritima ulvae]QEG42521.1 hypothetical protein UC8_45600 [Roseimaritima ulvae]